MYSAIIVYQTKTAYGVRRDFETVYSKEYKEQVISKIKTFTGFDKIIEVWEHEDNY